MKMINGKKYEVKQENAAVLEIAVMSKKHASKDFTELYKYLTDKYKGGAKCPAILFAEEGVPTVFENIQHDSIVLLNRESDVMPNDFEIALWRKKEILSPAEVKGLSFAWAPGSPYGVWYETIYKIGKHLEIPLPAIFLADMMPSSLSHLAGAAFPGGNVPYTTDIIVLMMNPPSYSLKTCLHELRHVWQHQYHNEWFNGYESFHMNNATAYYRQKAEIDADAFAYWVLQENGLRFHLEDLGRERCASLYERMKEIAKEEKPLYLPMIRK